MKQNLSLLIAALTFSAMQAGAQSSSAKIGAASSTNTSTSKIEDLKKPTEKLKDVDDEITDARLRATLGSKSKWSFKSSLGYSGGSVREPLSSVRPAYRTSSTDEVMAYLSGDIGINLRATDRDNVSFSTGMTINDPLHGDITKPATDETAMGGGEVMPRYEFSTPSISWSRGYKAMGTQMVSSVTYGHYTDSVSGRKNLLGGVSFSQTILANFGTSKWNGGVSISGGKTLYKGDLEDAKYKKAQDKGTFMRTDLNAGLFPFLQYSFNDTYSFRTVFGYFQFYKYELNDRWVQIEPYQSVGFGISVTRDIYLYPNIQFTPKDIRDDRTNVALSTNINLF
ncbi:MULTISPECIES: hypothetical protein [unclassified Bdellovibrio]|uniref:hypothetical protein n=1 Tax=unclassified Bdellovibrio TaxID=2633795 RepID=UPI001158D1EB|nr:MULTISPECIES: hypothetical protein [unclassified Bdellovibrio]QDK44229.1 hypothetical protein DOM22_03200 [Bdellovibrio sp. ZAP7]QLY26055.1 hypothetical protein HW988_03210 [Bdellovibrio sp. KM01]